MDCNGADFLYFSVFEQHQKTGRKERSSVNINDIVQKTVDSGASPLTLSYEKINYFESRKVILRSKLNINSLELGTLTPKQYRVVAGRGKQGGELLRRQIQKIFEEYATISARIHTLDSITLPILSRTLLEGAAAGIIFDEFEKNATVPPANICVELSSDLLFEDIERVRARIDELRGLSIKIAICELGDEFCPMLRLKDISFDHAFADEYALSMLSGDDEAAARALTEHVHILGKKVFAPEIGDELLLAAKNAGYDGYSLDKALIDPASSGEVSADEGE